MPNKLKSHEGVIPEQDWVRARLQGIRDEGLWRELREVDERSGFPEIAGRPVINFSGNDYLGLRRRPELLSAAAKSLNESGSGAGASRLLSGSKRAHADCEAALQDWSGKPALVLGSGYLANQALLSTFAPRDTLLLVDRLAHASLLDGALLSRAEMIRFKHNDLNSLEELLRKARRSNPGKRILVVTESLFSMDGDIAPLREMQSLCLEYAAHLVVDEAHAVGVFGRNGIGLCSEFGIEDEIKYRSATFSKALGSYGGFILVDAEARALLVNSARQFIYDTALPPHVCACAAAGLSILSSSPELGPQLREKSAYFRERLHASGVSVGGDAHILPIVLGESEAALKFAAALLERGVLAVAIRPPTVPVGKARIRFSISLAHSGEQLDQAAAAVVDVIEQTGLSPLEFS